jgi:hypothetical protein
VRKFITEANAIAWQSMPTPTHYIFTDVKKKMSPNTIYLGERNIGLFGDIENSIQKRFYDAVFNKSNHHCP